MNDQQNEDPNKTARLRDKMHSIVNRKCQHLLTAIFRSDKTNFIELLMLREETDKDALVVDGIFGLYDNIKDQNLTSIEEKRINDFLKQILKVSLPPKALSNQFHMR